MKSYSIGFILLVVFTSHSVWGQEKNSLVHSDTLPFLLTEHNNIIIECSLNTADTVQLMFHTAASGVTLIETSVERLTSVQWDTEHNVASWGGESSARFSNYNHLQIGAMQWDSIPIWENKRSGPKSDGKFGPDLFANKVIEIDFDLQKLIVHNHLPQKIEAYEKIALTVENEWWFVEGTSTFGQQRSSNMYLVHSGYGGALLYDDKYVREFKIDEKIAITSTQKLKDSYGNVLLTQKGILPHFSIDSLEFDSVPVGFFTGSIDRQSMSVIGGNILKRFNLIVDSNRDYIYLHPNTLNTSAF